MPFVNFVVMKRTTIVLDDDCLEILRLSKILQNKGSSEIIRDLIKDHIPLVELKKAIVEACNE